MKRAIIIMAKAPLAGTVKTRLQPRLTAGQCAELAACFLRDTINKASSLKNQWLIIAYSPAEERDFFERLANQKMSFVEQKGNNLGEKMFSAFEFAFRQKADAAVMIGTDSPTFPAEFIEQAFDYLEKADAVLGKTEDGGFYLIGLRKSDERMFEAVEWSTAETFLQTKENISRLGLKFKEAQSWYDVDEAEDLERLRNEFLNDKNAQRRAPQTFEWIVRNML